jgi:hypothetical protein
VAEATQAAIEPIPLPSLAAVAKTSESRLAVALDRLQRVGAVDVNGDGCVAWTGTAPVEELVDQAAADHERYRTTDRTRSEMMQRYLETGQCRWRTVLAYFGEPTAENCGHCDNCDAGVATADTPGDHDELFPLGARVAHATFGTGDVVACEDGTITVLFDNAGYRTLSVELVRENQLLAPARPPAGTSSYRGGEAGRTSRQVPAGPGIRSMVWPLRAAMAQRRPRWIPHTVAGSTSAARARGQAARTMLPSSAGRGSKPSSARKATTSPPTGATASPAVSADTPVRRAWSRARANRS